ncbi:YbaN family protein [Sphingomonas cavernae]|uniref:DUF454 domain-containing protein n=1 Tax=Sphingomonas cavernae TaxID=2320861 RepID=A0A418WKB7_9SPHN|nr:YbaN family protein [Sphingomonas cavernae]RJF90382.1 DUF454 domain-containing protein [Sphingomonas cavernae]
MRRPLNFTLGSIALLLGIVGAFVPLLPTTIFLIIAAFFFGRSSERMERWLLGHPRFGPTIVAWRRDRAISPASKLMACSGMAFGFVMLHFVTRASAIVEAGAALFLLACAAYVVTRPHPEQGSITDD